MHFQSTTTSSTRAMSVHRFSACKPPNFKQEAVGGRRAAVGAWRSERGGRSVAARGLGGGRAGVGARQGRTARAHGAQRRASSARAGAGGAAARGMSRRSAAGCPCGGAFLGGRPAHRPRARRPGAWMANPGGRGGRRSVLGARGRLEGKRGGARVPGLMQSRRARRDCLMSSLHPPRLRASSADDRWERRLRPRAAAAGGIGGPRPRAPAIGGDPTHLSARARCAICARAAPSARLEAFWATWLT